MFQLSLFYDKCDEEGNVRHEIAIRCSNCTKHTGLHLKDTSIKEMTTKFVLNEILHHVVMSWIICSKKELLYEIDKIYHPNWLNKGTWYNTDICSKLHGKCLNIVLDMQKQIDIISGVI